MPDQSSDVLLELRDLHLHFFTNEGVVRAVNGASYTVWRGKTLCVVGESGCGKSVTARAILKIIHRPGRIVGGQILYHRPLPGGGTETVDIAGLRPRGAAVRQIRGNEIAMIFQEPMTSLSALHTVGNQIIEAIRLHSRVTEAEARERAIDLLAKVGIPQPEDRIDEYPFRLSGGMRQRCMIAMALSCNPQLLIADEPTTALDVTTQAQILDLMLELQAEYGMSILFITHDLGVVAEIADDVAVMYMGTVVEKTDADTLFNAPRHPYTVSLLRSIPKIGPTRSRLDPIQGMVPSPFQRLSGCPFHPRCDRMMPGVCDRVVPPPIALAENHMVRCLLYDEQYQPAATEEASS
ncbi:MAG: ABC transporter ATP-binding protein [Chloroflexi bacterium]|nr:ABC transporter ATP-binding protein [Chloroflexota bacterium]